MSSVTLVHPAEVVGRNEVPFGRDTRVVSRNTVLDRGPRFLTGRRDLGVGTPVKIFSLQIAAKPLQIAEW